MPGKIAGHSFVFPRSGVAPDIVARTFLSAARTWSLWFRMESLLPQAFANFRQQGIFIGLSADAQV